MADIWVDVSAALSEVPVNILPLLDDTDFKTVKTSVAYNASGLSLQWNFVDTTGVMTQWSVTPTTGGSYDWASQGNGMYSIEIPASGGSSINNDTAGFGWFTGKATGVLPWRGPVIGFRASGLNDLLIDNASATTLNAIADALLKRDMSAVSGESARSPLNALRFLRNKWTITTGTLSVKKEDDSTEAWNAAIASDAAAIPIIGSDPS